MYDAFVIPEGGMIDNFKFMSVPNHLTATNGAGHRLSDKCNVIVNDTRTLHSEISEVVTFSNDVIKSILGITIPPFVLNHDSVANQS